MSCCFSEQDGRAQTARADGSDDITMALTGDAIISRHPSVAEESGVLRLREIVPDATPAALTGMSLSAKAGNGEP